MRNQGGDLLIMVTEGFEELPPLRLSLMAIPIEVVRDDAHGPVLVRQGLDHVVDAQKGWR